jgi:hypothetical protein
MRLADLKRELIRGLRGSKAGAGPTSETAGSRREALCLPARNDMRTASLAWSEGYHMTPEKPDQSPIDPAALAMHARFEIERVDALPDHEAMQPVPAPTAPIQEHRQEHRTSWRETLKAIFTYAHTVD